MTKRVSIGGADLAARIDPLGAELKSWRIGERELIWHGDPSSWPRSAPNLFPLVGRCAGGHIRIGDSRYPMPAHGFASSCEFAVERVSENEAVLSLSDTPETRRSYPFAFCLRIAFALSERSLAVRMTVVNEDEVPLPYAAGLHPGFAWPSRSASRGEQAVIEFSSQEDPRVPVIAPEGLFAGEQRPLEFSGRVMPLTKANLGSEAVCFLDARSREVTFRPGDGTSLSVRNDGFSHFAIWTKGEAPFLSVESWTGHGDAVGYTGEFADRPSMNILGPGERGEHTARYTFRETF